MGLDTVELVMAAEEEFGLEIPNAEAQQMERVGDLFAFIVRTLQQRSAPAAVDEADIWRRLTDIIVEQLGVRPEQVTLSAHFIRDLGAD